MPKQKPVTRYEQPKPKMHLGCALCTMICSDGPPEFVCSEKCKEQAIDEPVNITFALQR